VAKRLLDDCGHASSSYRHLRRSLKIEHHLGS
jgi:hypothetical protein